MSICADYTENTSDLQVKNYFIPLKIRVYSCIRYTNITIH